MSHYAVLNDFISNLDAQSISEDRKQTLAPLVEYIQDKMDKKESIRLNFICTHNSRRSHLSQIWAQTMAHYFGIKNVSCYSGGTEATALFPMVASTLANTGFEVNTLSEGKNPIYGIKFSENEHPVICFSKRMDDDFNPKSDFAAIMTCSQADEGCPFVPGAEKRIPITYEDPKAFDNSPQQAEKYSERSQQIAAEMFYVFSQIN
ncbi:arsenate-mycothiol transferase ArsC [Flagellimonas zhangzhouensis]|uniref:Arsenate reductase n=1 Tax=Flagellimonas zhangzhouensis TaxID=1073328 RepID=A0A1H2S550_9FLAO|nr:protein-tyrosine-phosphatase [Allomuricauda zhangzhouensis]SDQ70837.1 arsenate reductase [Allomuricauda zhangzhouensis]SDW26787.1 arsenate reductase [Allomuricauda zhangzhouensis]